MLSTRLRRRRRQWRVRNRSWGALASLPEKPWEEGSCHDSSQTPRLPLANSEHPRAKILRRASFHVMHKTAISFWPQGAMHPPLLEPLRPQGVFGDLCHECTDMWRSERAKTDLGT